MWSMNMKPGIGGANQGSLCPKFTSNLCQHIDAQSVSWDFHPWISIMCQTTAMKINTRTERVKQGSLCRKFTSNLHAQQTDAQSMLKLSLLANGHILFDDGM